MVGVSKVQVESDQVMEQKPRLIIGLGNPGETYRNTRHNVGFKTIDAMAEELGVSYWKDVGGAKVGVITYQGEQLVLAKPSAYMNASGGPVKNVCGHFGYGVEDILIIHDELDLPVDAIRLKRGGGHAGHNGLRSLHEKLGSEYARLRIGIGRPPGRMPAAEYVLQELRQDALDQLDQSAASAASIALFTVRDGVEAAMRKYNGTAVS